MAITRTRFKEEVLALLNEVFNTGIGDVPTGTDLSAEVNSETMLDRIINRSQNFICRYCYPVPGIAEYSLPIGRKVIQLSATTGRLITASSGDGSIMHKAQTVYWNGKYLREIRWNQFLAEFPEYHNAANGTPKYWRKDMDLFDYIGIHPPPTAVQTVVLHGFVLPPPINDSNEEISWMPDDVVLRAMVPNAALEYAIKTMDDPRMLAKMPVMARKADSEALIQYQQINPVLRDRFFPTPPPSLVETTLLSPTATAQAT